jgi:hypothetical protein
MEGLFIGLLGLVITIPVMPPFNYYALRHDGHEVITIFHHLLRFQRWTNDNSMRVNSCNRLIRGRPPAVSNLRRDPPQPPTGWELHCSSGPSVPAK